MNKLVEQQREHFNKISAQYFQARENLNHQFLKDLIWKNFIGRNSEIFAKIKRVLEPMCGMAEGYDIFCKNLISNIDYCGFDYSENMVEIVRRNKKSLKIEWDDVTTYQSSGELFDFIILVGGLHHVYSHTQDVLNNLKKSMCSGGYFVSFEPTHNNWFTKKIRQKIYKQNDFFDKDTEQGFDYHELNIYFKNAGYKKID